MTARENVDPPKWFGYLLRLALTGRISRDCFVGDLIEERNEQALRGEKLPNRNLWYARQLGATHLGNQIDPLARQLLELR